MKLIAVAYFRNLFINVNNYSNPCKFPRWNQTDYQFLSSCFTREEVKKVVFEMAPYKAPNPDRFQPVFYQKLWDIVGEDLTKVALDYLNNG